MESNAKSKEFLRPQQHIDIHDSFETTVPVEGKVSKQEVDDAVKYLIEITEEEVCRKEKSYMKFREAQAKLFAFPRGLTNLLCNDCHQCKNACWKFESHCNLVTNNSWPKQAP